MHFAHVRKVPVRPQNGALVETLNSHVKRGDIQRMQETHSVPSPSQQNTSQKRMYLSNHRTRKGLRPHSRNTDNNWSKLLIAHWTDWNVNSWQRMSRTPFSSFNKSTKPSVWSKRRAPSVISLKPMKICTPKRTISLHKTNKVLRITANHQREWTQLSTISSSWLTKNVSAKSLKGGSPTAGSSKRINPK